MFTGLIEDVGRVAGIERRQQAAVLRVETSLPLDTIALGDSVAVNGACLTVIERSGTTLSFDVSPETLGSTTIGSLQRGSCVNLERALRLGERLGGHIVTGHIDCTARLVAIKNSSGNRILEFEVAGGAVRYLVAKGSVAIDGISLTVNTVSASGFSVNIIPHTAEKTTLSALTTGQTVNIETDIIGKYVERLIQPWKSGEGLSLQKLAEHGFV